MSAFPFGISCQQSFLLRQVILPVIFQPNTVTYTLLCQGFLTFVHFSLPHIKLNNIALISTILCSAEKAVGTPAKWIFDKVTNLQNLKGKSEFSSSKKITNFGPNKMNTTYAKTLLITTLCQNLVLGTEIRIIAQIILNPLFGKMTLSFIRWMSLNCLVLWQIFEEIIDYSVSYLELMP